ncbi:MAG: hypothetical protein IPK80_00010 [Nannocystis sp.]|nr:hypothetical protein [Nannocystis sp.]
MSWLKRILIGVTLLLLVLVAISAWLFRSQAEAIPSELRRSTPPRIRKTSSSRRRRPARARARAELRGRTSYFVIEDRESMQAGEQGGEPRARPLVGAGACAAS